MEKEETIKEEEPTEPEAIKIPDKLMKNPYQVICSWAEARFPKSGKKIFQVVSLCPVSCIIPDIPTKEQDIRTNINALLLAPSGSAKTSCSNLFDKITYNSFNFKSITSARIEDELEGMQNIPISIICDDLAVVMKDQVLIKCLEGIIGDEKKVSRMTAHKTRVFKIEACSYLSGVPQDLSAYITSGFLFRCSPVVLFHSIKEQEQVGKYISKNIGVASGKDITSEDIKNYYQLLLQIQEGDHPDIPKIKGYIFTEFQRQEIERVWNETLKALNPDNFTLWYRELESGFRYLVCSAFLNIFNREVEKKNNIAFLKPNDEDLGIALKLMHREIITKLHILKSDRYAKRIKSLGELQKLADKQRWSQFTQNIMKMLIKK